MHTAMTDDGAAKAELAIRAIRELPECGETVIAARQFLIRYFGGDDMARVDHETRRLMDQYRAQSNAFRGLDSEK